MQTDMWPQSSKDFLRGTVMYYFSDEYRERKIKYENQEVITLAAYLLLIIGGLILSPHVGKQIGGALISLSYFASLFVVTLGLFLTILIIFSTFVYRRVFSDPAKLKKVYKEPQKMYGAAVFLYAPAYAPVYANGVFWCVTIILLAATVFHESILLGVLTVVTRVLIMWTDRIRKNTFLRVSEVWGE